MAGGISIEGLKAQAETAKQVTALSTGAVAFTVTFIEKFTHKDSGAAFTTPYGLYACWGLFGLTILFAMWYLIATTGAIDAVDRKLNGWSLSEAQRLAAEGDHGHMKFPGIAMVLCFLAAIAMMIATGLSL